MQGVASFTGQPAGWAARSARPSPEPMSGDTVAARHSVYELRQTRYSTSQVVFGVTAGTTVGRVVATEGSVAAAVGESDVGVSEVGASLGGSVAGAAVLVRADDGGGGVLVLLDEPHPATRAIGTQTASTIFRVKNTTPLPCNRYHTE